jgi:hypothetical protein
MKNNGAKHDKIAQTLGINVKQVGLIWNSLNENAKKSDKDKRGKQDQKSNLKEDNKSTKSSKSEFSRSNVKIPTPDKYFNREDVRHAVYSLLY